MRPTVRSAVRLFAINLATLVLLALVIEGGSSYVLALHGAFSTKKARVERHYTRYDRDLGWVSVPHAHLANLFGPGIDVNINAQGFRADADTLPHAPPGKIRVVCSGDSFTFGYGVDSAHSWCQLLAAHDPRIEPVNLGQCGYGLDQAYLWYTRDGERLDPGVQVLAFVTPDFLRMESPLFEGYGKPVLALQGDALAVGNVPVPRSSPGLGAALLDGGERLRTGQFLVHLLHLDRAPATDADGEETEATRRLLHALFADLKRRAAARGARLVLVYIPLKGELVTPPAHWIRFVETEARALDVPLVNLFDAFRALPLPMVESLYIPKGRLDYPGAAGHLTVEGNARVADAVATVLEGASR